MLQLKPEPQTLTAAKPKTVNTNPTVDIDLYISNLTRQSPRELSVRMFEAPAQQYYIVHST